MKRIYNLFVPIIFLTISALKAQEKGAVSLEGLVSRLNKEIAPTIQFSIEKDKALLTFSGKEWPINLARKTSEKLYDTPTEKSNGRYIGPIFWLYNFSNVKQTKAAFELDSLRQIQLRISMNKADTVLIGSKLNEYSCHHPITDSQLHQVLWTGEKAFIIGLEINTEQGKTNLKFRNVKIFGGFKRKGRFKLSFDYLSGLESRFQRELTALEIKKIRS